MNQHTALIVEDERDMAAEIGELLHSMGYSHVAVDNLADARRLLDEGTFCFVLLDLQIKAEKFSIRPRVEAGMPARFAPEASAPQRQRHAPASRHRGERACQGARGYRACLPGGGK